MPFQMYSGANHEGHEGQLMAPRMVGVSRLNTITLTEVLRAFPRGLTLLFASAAADSQNDRGDVDKSTRSLLLRQSAW